MSDAAAHFSTEALGEPAGPGRYVSIGSIDPAEFVPGLGFRPVLGQRAMANFVDFEPGVEAPRHVHEEEQIVIVLDGEFTFDLDGDVRVMRPGDVAVVPAWVPHGAWTTDSRCREVDIFCPPRQSLLNLAAAQGSQARDGQAESSEVQDGEVRGGEVRGGEVRGGEGRAARPAPGPA
jgi:quercetin dioxygenase-like cupin family protein